MEESDTLCEEEQTELAGTIKAIDKGSVHRICSGQVVLTLATAVKELIENSIDAGATSVEVKLRDYGSQVVEVIDNGSGVEEKNFEGLTLKHHTSKLQDFSDLAGVETFGFRGEALSSLCALSGLTVVTRHTSSDVGTKMEFDHNGRISQRTAQARQVGTTVILQNIFSTLPVRHKEFQRNIKKEFAKMVNVMNSYCIISTNVRITCSNQTAKGQRSIVVSSKGNSSMRDNISNVFGPKQINSLHEIKQVSPNEEVSCEYGLGSSGGSQRNVPFRLEGYISKCVHGLGRSSADRQYFFINKRPCDSTKLSKVINEVYHQYNRHQYPFVALDVTMARDAVDVNVTPDKRQIFMQDEKLLLATIKTSLLALYQPTIGVMQFKPVQTSLSGGSSTKGSEARKHMNRSTEEQVSTSSDMAVSSLSRLKRSYASVFSTSDDTPSKEEQVSKQRKLDTFVTKKTSSTSGGDLDTTETKVILVDSVALDPPETKVTSEDRVDLDRPETKVTSEDCVDLDPPETKVTSEDRVDLDPPETKVTSEDDNVVVLSGETGTGPQPDTPTDCESGISSSKDTLTSGSPSQSSQEILTVGSQCQSSQDGKTLGSQDQSSQGTFLFSSQDSLADNFLSQSDRLESLSQVINEENTRTLSSSECSQSVKACLSDDNLDMSAFSYSDSSSRRSVGDTKPSLKSIMKAVLSVKPTQQHQTLLRKRMSSSCGDIKSGSFKDRSFTSSSTDEGHMSDLGPSTSSSTGKGHASDFVYRETEEDSGERENANSVQEEDESEVTITEFDQSETRPKHEKSIKFSMLSLRTRASQRQKTIRAKKSKEEEFYRTFRASITPTDNQSAESELQREITQDMFAKMEILGQFNLGFIIAKSGDDLFIVDQHATDEKYNFEQLQKHTVLQSQRLIQPKNLELTASNETILMDNLDIFRQNGFEFLIDEQAPPTQRVKLVSTPVSKNWNFGKEDVEEMIFMLSDSPGVMCRPSRVRQMFASRSCRKSIMIGTALNQAEMKRLVTHMGEIEQPWNCPHGRPTMRHLINLNMVPR